MKSEKHKFDQFHNAVDKKAHEQNLADQPVIDSESFITRYKLLTDIFDSCAGDAFGYVKPYRGNASRLVTSAPIRRIMSQIKSVCGAIHMANNPEGDVSVNSILLYNKSHREFQRDPNGHDNLRSYLVQIRKKLYKDLYRERMEVVTAHAKEADQKRIAGALYGGSTKRLVNAQEYIGLPMAVNVLDESGDVVIQPEKVKDITRDYFQELYHHNDPPNVPKPWMQSPSVTDVKDRVSCDPFIWPKLANVNYF
jgi:hypothetical protein